MYDYEITCEELFDESYPTDAELEAMAQEWAAYCEANGLPTEW